MNKGLRRGDIACDVLAFGLTAFYIAALEWNARDMIWGLWVSSFCVGYAHIVVAIFASAWQADGWGKLLMALGGLPLLAFFTVHFGMFHYVHSMFLNGFFPLVDDQDVENIFNTLGVTVQHYWPLVLATFLSRFSDFPWGMRSGQSGNTLMAPYGNVVRMHLLIFVFAGLHAAGWTDLALYPIVAFYFVPWSALLGHVKTRVMGRSASTEAV